jgi:arsenite methyltransferase
VTENAPSQQQISLAIADDIEKAVLERDRVEAKQQESSLCCPTEYEGIYLNCYLRNILKTKKSYFK